MDLAILLNKDTFEPAPTVFTFKADSTRKNTWGMVLLIVRSLLRRLSLVHRFVLMSWLRNTELLQFLRAKNVVIHACEDSVLWTSNIGNVLLPHHAQAPTNGVLIRMAATNLTMPRLALVPGINLLTSLFSSTFATPIFQDPVAQSKKI